VNSHEVVILEPAVLGLVGHLRKSGLQVSPGDVRAKIERGMSRGWGTPSAKPFNDANGAGWVVDLSDQFNDEMLYAVVRSSGGSRQVVAVIEADDIEALQREKRSLPSVASALGSEEEPGSTEAPSTQSRAPARRPDPFPAKPAEPAPDSPVLVVVLDPNVTSGSYVTVTSGSYRNGNESQKVENLIRTTHAEVRDTVARLLQEGIRPEHIEIWSSRRQPKVQIAFE
jgi:hypothetical protein